MGQTDKQFSGFLRLLIRDLKDVLNEADPAKKQEMLKTLLGDLQAALED